MRAARNYWPLSFAAVIGLLVPASGRAWGPEGHNLIVDAAFARLSQRTLDQIRTIRTSATIRHQYDHLDNRTHRTRHEDCRDDTIEALANWPDCIRYESDRSYSDTAGNHFDDIPWRAPVPPRESYCEGTCGSLALQAYVATLRDRAAPAEARLRALAFVLHIVGDLHQPLHTINNGAPHAGDNGGNGIRISATVGSREFSNLHSLWDGGMILAAFAPGENRVQTIQRLARQNASRFRTEVGGRGGERAPQWVSGTHRIAVEAYDLLPQRPHYGDRSFDAGAIPPAYVEHFEEPTREQLARAAVRLADVLNDALGS